MCPQGKILVTEGDRELTLTANTRHAGAGFHAFCVDIFKDIEEEQMGKYELIDDLNTPVTKIFTGRITYTKTSWTISGISF